MNAIINTAVTMTSLEIADLVESRHDSVKRTIEREPGVASVSAPVRDAKGAVIAAISVSGPIDRMGRRPGERWASDLLAASEALTRRL